MLRTINQLLEAQFKEGDWIEEEDNEVMQMKATTGNQWKIASCGLRCILTTCICLVIPTFRSDPGSFRYRSQNRKSGHKSNTMLRRYYCDSQWCAVEETNNQGTSKRTTSSPLDILPLRPPVSVNFWTNVVRSALVFNRKK